MVKEFKRPTWAQRAELRKILDRNNCGLKDLLEKKELPFEYCDGIPTWCYDLTDEEKDKLTYGQIAEMSIEAFMKIEIGAEQQKKS